MSATTPEGQAPPAGPRVDEVGRRVELLLDRLGELDPAATRVAEELVRSLVELYGAGLIAILERLHASEPAAIHDLANDPLVGGLMALHDLHPVPVEARIEAALDDCRPYLRSHGGDVTLLGVTDTGTVQLRLEGTCDGCAASALTLATTVESAVLGAAPEVTGVDVEGATPLGVGHAPPPGVVLPVDAGRERLPMFQATT